MLRTLFLCAASVSASVQDPPPRSVEKVFRVGEESNWIFESEGRRIGEHASRYLGPDEVAGRAAHHFEGRVRLEASALGELRLVANLWTDGSGRALRFTQESLLGEAYARVELDFTDGDVTAQIVQGPSTRRLTLKSDPGAFVLANNFVSHIDLALALQELGPKIQLPMFSGSVLQGFPYEVTAAGTSEVELDGTRKTALVFEDSLGERLRLVGGRLFDIEVPAQKLVIRRSSEPIETFTITPPAIRSNPARFAAEDVRIELEEGFLAGRLTKPRRARGRLPALFFISGSGPQDRNGMSSGIDLGTHEILDRLTADGFLVLRVDDRGAGESSPQPPDMSFDDLVADARACVAFLRKREDVDPERIALIGHSEGGLTAMVLGVELDELAAVVLMAAPGRSMLAILTEQNRMVLERAGLSGEELERRLQEVVQLLERLMGAEPIDPASLPEEQRGFLASRAWMQSHARRDPIAMVRRLACPVLILHGGKDFQVSAERDARALADALRAAEHPDAELHVFAGLDHLFKKTPGERSELADYALDRAVDPEFLGVLSAWLAQRLRPERR